MKVGKDGQVAHLVLVLVSMRTWERVVGPVNSVPNVVVCWAVVIGDTQNYKDVIKQTCAFPSLVAGVGLIHRFGTMYP